MENRLTRQQATDFLAVVYGGAHRIPSTVKPWGDGWCISAGQTHLENYISDILTRLVILGHDQSIRVSVFSSKGGDLRISLFKSDIAKPQSSLEMYITSLRIKMIKQ